MIRLVLFLAVTFIGCSASSMSTDNEIPVPDYVRVESNFSWRVDCRTSDTIYGGIGSNQRFYNRDGTMKSREEFCEF